MTSSARRRQGFALIVVLATLSIVALLFAITSSRFLAGLAGTEVELTLGKRQQENLAFSNLSLEFLGAEAGQSTSETNLVLQFDNREVTLVFQDVGGLVDLNTAAPELLEALAKGLEIPSEAVERFREWRRTPYRLQNVLDFARVADVPYDVGLALRRLSTVHSGRYGISPDVAPSALIDLLDVSRIVGFGSDFPSVWVTPASGVVYQVELWEGGRFVRLVGVVHSGLGGGRILELY